MSAPRIIAGKARGFRLQDVPGNVTRPITDMVKGALFNIIGNDILKSSLLDLFGGTGSVGIEALSRGAAFVRLNDNNAAANRVIKANLEHTKLQDGAEVTLQDAFQLLRARPDRSFDYIFIAPPQYKGMWLRALQELDGNSAWLAEGGWVIVQIDPVEYSQAALDHLQEFEQRKYGNTLLVFYEAKTT